MIDRELLYNDLNDKLEYWRELEKSCNRMIVLYEEQLKQMEAERDDNGACAGD